MPRRQWAISVRRIIEEAQIDIIIARREVRSRWDRKGGIAVEGRVEDAARIGIVDAEAPAARRSQRKIRRSSEIGGPFRRALDPVAPKLRPLDHLRVERDRKSVVKGKSVSVRVDLGGRRIIKKKTKTVVTIAGQLHTRS